MNYIKNLSRQQLDNSIVKASYIKLAIIYRDEDL